MKAERGNFIAGPALLLLLLGGLAIGFTSITLPTLPRWPALIAAEGTTEHILFVYSDLPRLAVSLLAGACLALAGTIFQLVLRNPLASPTTLGTAAGAQLALTISIAIAPSALAYSRELIAVVGAATATMLVFTIAMRRHFSPVVLILAGLLISLYCGAVQYGISLFHQEQLASVFIWSAGSLLQNGWSGVIVLAPALCVIGFGMAFLVRPLTLMALGDGQAQSLGLPIVQVRLIALLAAVVLSALVVSNVGDMGFVGLVAPWLARLCGARTASAQIVWSPPIGAVLLWIADQLAQIAGGGFYEVPTGIVTAAIGAPILLLLLRRVRTQSVPSAGTFEANAPDRSWLWIASSMVALVPAIALGLSASWTGQGMQLALDPVFGAFLEWRGPRVFAAVLAGCMLSLAGAMLQRLLNNPMASPEVLGVSSGAMLGMILTVIFLPATGNQWHLAGAAGGAFLTLASMLWLGRRTGFAPERMLLAGVAVTTFCGALFTALLAAGDPRLLDMMGLLAGSTYGVGWDRVSIAAMIALPCVLGVFMSRRWLDILMLGPLTASALGMGVAKGRLALLLLSSVMVAGSTLLVGPISFVGLMAPHIARLLGFRTTLMHLAASALTGTLIMILADWIGRNAMFPYQLPVGLVSTLIGGPYIIWLLWKNR
ncbi:Fe3+-hydroxamate ABC transporter permease FhuB [Brucella endophytica]|uniref:Fe3+-hydroxamate ABC transporter permease FhuB n=1 Tax=Brucella endophytica TaxID=1963359 RepID=A0A916SLQ1_9HYPH|nr:Fe(3+)-hydroxamate ABC transporter permease FhuB [Brucella endophytica]GGB05572.1 Fe3+-hydroxamate ABC transporter permease FhuB [Brucella endophytica]